jgi:hypothetical protein
MLMANIRLFQQVRHHTVTLDAGRRFFRRCLIPGTAFTGPFPDFFPAMSGSPDSCRAHPVETLGDAAPAPVWNVVLSLWRWPSHGKGFVRGIRV